MGPTGKLIEPLGDLTFDEAAGNFAAQAKVLEKSGVDFILIEALNEIQEFRAAVVGILAAVKIPVIASMCFPTDALSLTGTNGAAFAVTSDFAGLSAIGSNCGSSLENMKTVMEQISRYSPLPLICQPNAGIPALENNKTIFNVTAGEFVDFMEDIYKLGVSILGSCCGSTPEFTRRLARRFKGKPVIKRNIYNSLALSTRTGIREISRKKIFVVGERINPCGRKKMRKELEAGIFTAVRAEAREQVTFGCDALDINISMQNPDLEILERLLAAVQDSAHAPLIIDSMDPMVIETFAKYYAGKGVINSIPGEKKALKQLLPLARRYNLAFIAAPIDEHGVPGSAAKRLAAASFIVDQAREHGIPLKNIIFDPLLSSAAADTPMVTVTLETIELLKKKFPDNKIIIGLSNISFGLPNRQLVNAVFLALAAARGVDMVIANPLQETLRHHMMAINFLETGSRENLELYTDYFAGLLVGKGAPIKTPANHPVNEVKKISGKSLYDNIVDEDPDAALVNIKELLEREAPLDIVDKYISPAMDEVGRRYQNRECFLPQLMASADVVKTILPFVKARLPQKRGKDSGPRVLFAAVKGDVHDIGKNIVMGILESFNYTVIDLGKDVPARSIVSEALKKKVQVIALSALMTTTLPALFDTIAAIKKRKRLTEVAVFIGGAVVTREMADQQGVYYGKNAVDMANVLKEIF
jgi:5-methyltetrahydrofolate--homocysteine methyltransferase